jgi:hypothetical protein
MSVNAKKVALWRVKNPETFKKQQTRHNKRYYDSHQEEMKEKASAYREQKRKIIQQFKNAPCMDCHGWFEPCQMDFDHVDGTKISDLSHMKSRSLKIVLEEIEKCDLVCANCHRLRTEKRRTYNIVSVKWYPSEPESFTTGTGGGSYVPPEGE